MTKVLVFGDSLVNGLEFSDSYEIGYHVESYPGLLARDAEALLQITLSESEYDVVALCLGTNDLGHGLLPQDVVNSVLHLHHIIRAKSSSTQIIAMNLHSNFHLFNDLFGSQAAEEIEFLGFFYELEEGDLVSDQFHLSAQGRIHFAECIEECVEELVCAFNHSVALV
jgi:lysophospholipase L1-like esterase